MDAILHESSLVDRSKNIEVNKENGCGDNEDDSKRCAVMVDMKTENVSIGNTRENFRKNYVDMEFENIVFTATEGTIFTKKITKQILHEINGRFPPGQLVAIMGPSGAGKSTLLDILSGYRIRGVRGTVKINGHQRNLKEFRKFSCYITQDDRLQPLLTVEENMRISADLKLPSNVTDKEKEKIIEDILITLNLNGTRKVRAAGLSGGQKKRLSIALELVNNPMVMFLDEPTTGLDSSSCTMCLKLLKELTQQGKTIICTIHQPAASIFSLFDQVYVLGGGYCLYQGNTVNLMQFLIDIESPCPVYHNPADYVVELACGEYGKDKPQKMRRATDNGKSLRYFNEPEKLSAIKVCGRLSGKTNGGLPTSSLHQLKILLKRGFVRAFRDETLTYLRLSTNIIVGLMLGTIYWKSGSDGSKVMDNYNLMFAILMHNMMATMMLTILTFPQEMSILIKEHFNRWYSLKMYYTAVTLVDIPISVMCCFLFTSIIYYMTDQPLETVRFLMFLITSIMVVFVAQGVGLMVGAYFDVVNGTFVGPTLAVPMMMFSGFGVRICDLPSYLYWGNYVSYLKYGLEGLIGSIYGLNRGILDCPEDKYCYYKYPKTFLEIVDVKSDQFDNDMIALLIFLFVIRISAYVILRYKLAAVR
ncbi:ATP-binding cassette sub-family G member 1 [Diorhabda carinulata]|uniref:ATP-binding cassette sub-family G member 1 n=1 Tax=Diorhabda carinulata TaxID=1163345 RepID=UPI0025A1EB88|nr:ATP-binding cassette sub-family G member 1 [Diorhabda carinulata]